MTMEDHVKNMASANASENDAVNKPVNSEEKAVTVAVEPEKKKKRTVGNIIYDFGVFGSFAWLGVTAMSALVGHEAMYGNNKYFNWLRAVNTFVHNGTAKFLSKYAMKNSSKESIDGLARSTSLFATMGMAGHSLMPPIKWLEDNRQKNAAKIDNLLGTEPPDPETIAKEPKQSWKSVFSGRMLSWGLSFASCLAMGPKLVSKLNNYFGEKGANSWMSFKPQSNPKSVRKWSDIIAFDAIFTVVTAFVTYAFSRFVAKKDDKENGTGDNLYKFNRIAPNPLGDSENEVKKNEPSFAKDIKAGRKISIEPHGSFIERVKSEEALLGQVRV